MQVIFTPQAKVDLDFWVHSGNKGILKKVSELIIDCSINPFSGLGKPEPLKFELSGKWSRRINKEHRLIYEVKEDFIYIYSVRGHYL